jgi:hypothetical protein
MEKIQACKNDCILYRGAKYEDLEKCPICGLNQFNCTKDGGDDENYSRSIGLQIKRSQNCCDDIKRSISRTPE